MVGASVHRVPTNLGPAPFLLRGVGCPSVITGEAPMLPPVLQGLGQHKPPGPHLLPSTYHSGCSLSSYSPRGWAVRAFTLVGPVPFQKGPLGLSTGSVCVCVGGGASCPAPAGWCPGSGAGYTRLGVAHRAQGGGVGQFSFQSQRKAMPKNVQSISQLHSSHTLAGFPCSSVGKESA